MITDLGLLRPNPATCRLELTHLHPGVSLEQAKAATGWDLEVSQQLAYTDPPTSLELSALRKLAATLAGNKPREEPR